MKTFLCALLLGFVFPTLITAEEVVDHKRISVVYYNLKSAASLLTGEIAPSESIVNKEASKMSVPELTHGCTKLMDTCFLKLEGTRAQAKLPEVLAYLKVANQTLAYGKSDKHEDIANYGAQHRGQIAKFITSQLKQLDRELKKLK